MSLGFRAYTDCRDGFGIAVKETSGNCMALRTSPHLVMIGRDKEGPLAGAAGTGLCVAVCLACCVYVRLKTWNMESRAGRIYFQSQPYTQPSTLGGILFFHDNSAHQLNDSQQQSLELRSQEFPTSIKDHRPMLDARNTAVHLAEPTRPYRCALPSLSSSGNKVKQGSNSRTSLLSNIEWGHAV